MRLLGSLPGIQDTADRAQTGPANLFSVQLLFRYQDATVSLSFEIFLSRASHDSRYWETNKSRASWVQTQVLAISSTKSPGAPPQEQSNRAVASFQHSGERQKTYSPLQGLPFLWRGHDMFLTFLLPLLNLFSL